MAPNLWFTLYKLLLIKIIYEIRQVKTRLPMKCITSSLRKEIEEDGSIRTCHQYVDLYDSASVKQKKYFKIYFRISTTTTTTKHNYYLEKKLQVTLCSCQFHVNFFTLAVCFALFKNDVTWSDFVTKLNINQRDDVKFDFCNC